MRNVPQHMFPCNGLSKFTKRAWLHYYIINLSHTNTGMKLTKYECLASSESPLNFLVTTSCRLTCIHAKLFPTVKRRTCIHVLRHYSRNSYSNFGRHAIFSQSSGSRLWDPGQKALQTTIDPTLFVDFCLIPLSNTCSFVRPARNVSREIFLHRQEGFCVGKFSRVVDQAVLENRPLRKHFVIKDGHCSKSSHWELKMSMRKRFYFGVLT